MKVLITLITGFFLLISNLNGQILMNLQLPSPGINIKPQLWNMSLINSSASPLSVRIEMSMSDMGNNRLVLSGVSRNIILQTGANQFTYNDLFPITYNASNPSYQVDNNPEGFLPVGTFNICYTVLWQNNDALEKMAEECETLEIEPLSPPQLIVPADNDRISINRPLFSWMPPMPYHLINRLTYDLVLVEVKPFQTAIEAVQQNVPLFKQFNVPTSQYQYPGSLPVLDTAKLYAWQVYSKNNSMAIAASEVWSFRVENPGTEPLLSQQKSSYSKTSKQPEAAFSLVSSDLRIELQNLDNVAFATAEIFELTSSGKRSMNPGGLKLPINIGQNFLHIDLEKVNGIKEKVFYQLELIAGRQKRYIKFQYKKSAK